MMTSENEDSADHTRRRSKVDRVIHEYGLAGMDEQLVTRWTGENGNRSSLRDLADYVNRELLRTTMEQADMAPLDGEVENTYRLLTDDETTVGTRIEVESTLDRQGIDVEKLSRDFVSHQAVHTYLTKYRDVNSPRSDSESDQVSKTVETIQRLQSRLVAVAENGLQSLRDTDRISLGDFSLLVDIRVFCEECGTQRPIVELLEDGGCECKD